MAGLELLYSHGCWSVSNVLMIPFSTRMICALLSETSREQTASEGVARVSKAS